MSQLDVISSDAAIEPSFSDVRSDMTIMPRGGEAWAGQRVKLRKGRYLASFELVNTREQNGKGCKKMDYDFTFSRRSAKPLKGLGGRFTIQTIRDGKSIRSNLKMHVDLNGDGTYKKKERLVKATKEGFKIKDSITTYLSDDFQAAKDLGSLGESGYLSFDIKPYQWSAPNIRFDEFSNGRMKNFFDIDLSSWSSKYNPVC